MLTPTDAAVRQARVVSRPWGREETFALVKGSYCGKMHVLHAGTAFPLRVHRRKDQVLWVLSGHAQVEIGTWPGGLVTLDLRLKDAVHVPRGWVHRVKALTEVILLEVSDCDEEGVEVQEAPVRPRLWVVPRQRTSGPDEELEA